MNECSIILAHMETNQCTFCDVISRALCHDRTYPVATQKDVADLQCMCILVSRFSHYVASSVACAVSMTIKITII